jgi:hypothetical protein
VRLICASFRDSSPSNQIGVLYVAIYQRPGETAIRRILGITLPPQLLQTRAKSYSSTAHDKSKVHKYRLRRSIFTAESS